MYHTNNQTDMANLSLTEQKKAQLAEFQQVASVLLPEKEEDANLFCKNVMFYCLKNKAVMNGETVTENEFPVTAGTDVTISNVLVGSTITIEELNAANYDTVVEVNGTPVTPNAAGKYEIPVKAGMVIEFINTYKIDKFFELDIDSVVGYEEVLKLRKKLEHLTEKQCIPVWHTSRGKEDFLKTCGKNKTNNNKKKDHKKKN